MLVPEVSRAVATPRGRVLDACAFRPVDRTPVWFKRQAGGHLPGYRELTERHSFLTLTGTPDLCAEVMMLPIRHLDVDAAVLYVDVTQPLPAMGFSLDISYSKGPQIADPLRDAARLGELRVPAPEETAPGALQAIHLVKQALGADRAVVGSLGGPFTVACYAIEGSHGTGFAHVRALLQRDPELWNRFATMVTDTLIAYARAQAHAGVDVIQLFDPWSAQLHVDDYAAQVAPHTRRLFEAIAELGVPSIHSGGDSAGRVEAVAAAGGDLISVDWRVHLDQVRRQLDGARGIQGNLDPAVLLAPWEVVDRRLGDVLARAGDHPGYLFSLGAPVVPGTDLGTLQRLVETVHSRAMSPELAEDGGA